MDMSQRATVMRLFREAVQEYRRSAYIDEDSRFHAYYLDGTYKNFPDDADGIRLRGIKNIWYITADDCGDFTYDFIGTSEQYNFIFNVIHGGDPLFKPKRPLIIDATVDYGWIAAMRAGGTV
jgi:hypothetical protein